MRSIAKILGGRKIKRVAVVSVEKHAHGLAWKIKELLSCKKEIWLVSPNKPKDIMVVCGGDGFLLATARKYLDNTKAFFGVNLGTVGFLMNDYTGPTKNCPSMSLKAVDDICQSIVNDQYKENKYLLLRAEIEYFDKSGEQVLAINDLSIERQGNQAARLEVCLDGVDLPVYSGDGLLVGTPAGSTAYTLAAGGTPIDHAAKCFILTPNNPQRSAEFANLSVPLVLAANRVMEIKVVEAKKRPVKIVVDGVGRNNLKSVRISVDSEKTLALLWLPSWNYFERISKKIIGVKARR